MVLQTEAKSLERSTLGPMPVRKVVLCTAGAEMAGARYAARRLAEGLGDVELHVFYQSGKAKLAGHDGDQGWPLRLKQSYWGLRHWLAHPGRSWRRWSLHRAYGPVSRYLPAQPKADPDEVTVHQVRSINDCPERIEQIDPDVLVIYSGGLVGPEVLSAAKVALNIHCGKLPEYRGVKSAVFALAEGRPDLVGVTLHLARPALDAGEQVRWQPVWPGGCRNLGELSAKLTVTAFDMMVETLAQLPKRSTETVEQVGDPRMYRGRDLSESVIGEARRQLRSLGKSNQHHQVVRLAPVSVS